LPVLNSLQQFLIYGYNFPRTCDDIIFLAVPREQSCQELIINLHKLCCFLPFSCDFIDITKAFPLW